MNDAMKDIEKCACTGNCIELTGPHLPVKTRTGYTQPLLASANVNLRTGRYGQVHSLHFNSKCGRIFVYQPPNFTSRKTTIVYIFPTKLPQFHFHFFQSFIRVFTFIYTQS